MARTIARSEKMMKTIVFRATDADRAALKLAAQSQGLDCSGLIRQMLIREKIFSPTGADATKDSF